MLSSFKLFTQLGHLYPQPEESGSGPSPPTNAYVAENGTTYYVAEDGVTYYVQES
jgi:hypothetical protein